MLNIIHSICSTTESFSGNKLFQGKHYVPLRHDCQVHNMSIIRHSKNQFVRGVAQIVVGYMPSKIGCFLKY